MTFGCKWPEISIPLSLPVCLAVYRFHSESKSSLGNEWKRFFPEWHTVYTRYKSSSRIIEKNQKLLTIALPLIKSELTTSKEHLKVIQDIISRIDFQIIKDLEILIITDVVNADELLTLGDLSVGVSFHFVEKLNKDSFAETLKLKSNSFALHCPPLIRNLPTNWYVNAIDLLLDAPYLEFENNNELPLSHPFFYEEGNINPRKLMRTKVQRKGKKFPIISVIIPTYNRSSILPKCIDAIKNQTFRTRQN